MGVIEDTIKAIERIPAWRRALKAAEELDALKGRVAAIEARLAPATGDSCPRCREMAFRLIDTVKADPPWDEMGLRVDVFRCAKCKYEDRREKPL